ncbi:cell division protein DivIVA, putative [Geotalea daltonii FRC-32]|uniref:Cell division protein DivIVA, putative n=1 Tax=Geotalea daltonii (strain DSM 22248 / JCM 15807 / FRC-32) TaxID=316067 RepID=B9M765_GEODF|nr:DivIVA domain-containing protein [Geotalea daltonii]ACM20153.1 cell division protein DivIVA, putative [Geotalea daltonii FRC-32]
MKITPIDIQQQQFKGKMIGGLDPEDVDAFLQMVAQEMEGLLRENNELKEQLNRNSAAMAAMEGQETKLRDAVLAAQNIAEDMKANARKEATLLVSEAELKGERIIAAAEQKLVELTSQIQDLRREKVQFETSLKSLLDAHYKMLSFNEE